ncbi:hypothetical protein FRC17_009182 [Serendipita sp. 399]|nr:hypothetical protein FRC17_009182 [Serendipita sp. 399]
MSNGTTTIEPTVLTVSPSQLFAFKHDVSNVVDVAVDIEDGCLESAMDARRVENHKTEITLTKLPLFSYIDGGTGHLQDLRPTSFAGLGISDLLSVESELSPYATPPIDEEFEPKESLVASFVADGKDDMQLQEIDYFNTCHRRPQDLGLCTAEESPSESEYDAIETPEDLLSPHILDELETLAVRILTFAPTIDIASGSLDLSLPSEQESEYTKLASYTVNVQEIVPIQHSYRI